MNKSEFSQEEIEQLKPLSKNAKILLFIGGLFAVSTALSGTFINVYLWKSKKDFLIIGKFNLMQYLFIPLSYVIGGMLVKKKNGTLSLRLGILFHSVFYLCILLLNSKAPNYVILLGALLGIGIGFYWLASNTLAFDLTTRFNRDTFNSFMGLIFSISGMISPIISSYIIIAYSEFKGYKIVFAISFGIFMLICFASLLLKSQTFQSPYTLKSSFQESNSCWKCTLIVQLLFGIRNGVLLFVINVLIFMTTNDEVNVGKLALVSAIFSALAYFTLEKWMKPYRRLLVFKIGVIMIIVSILFLVIKINLLTLLIFSVVNGFFYPFFIVPVDSSVFNIIEKNNKIEQRTEYIVLKDVALNIGRIIGVALFISGSYYSPSIKMIQVLLAIIGLSQLLLLILIRKLDFDVNIV